MSSISLRVLSRRLLRPRIAAAAAHAHHPLRPASPARFLSTIPKKKKKKNVPQAATAGRIAFADGGRLNKAAVNPKLCVGCGVELVSNSQRGESKTGFVAGDDARQVERSKRQERKARYADITESSKVLCGRCKALQKGDVWRAYDSLRDVDAKVFSAQLSHIVGRRRFGLCLVVVDATDEFSSVKRLRDMVRGTPCVLAINKADLLPSEVTERDTRYLRARFEGRGVKMIGAYSVSARTSAGMVDLAEGLLRGLGGRDVFVVGAANVGKSTLVKGLSSLLAKTIRMKGKNKRADDLRREELQNLQVTTSHLPGTTLQAVRIPCFPSKRHALWDTPGIINRYSLAYGLFPSHLMEPLAFPTPIRLPTVQDRTFVKVKAGRSVLIEARWVEEGEKEEEEGSLPEEGGGPAPASPHEVSPDGNSASFTLARLDIMEDGGLPVEVLAFVPSCLRVRVVPTAAAPARATIPDSYVAKVSKLVRDAGNFKECDTSRPLALFTSGQGLEEGVLVFDQSKDADMIGWIRRDLVFASLGWLMLNHRGSFAVRPWCVEGSLWSKRKAMYRSDIGNTVEGVGEWTGTTTPAADPNDEETKLKLRKAAEYGRHMAGRGKAAEKPAHDGAESFLGGNFWGDGDGDADYW